MYLCIMLPQGPAANMPFGLYKHVTEHA